MNSIKKIALIFFLTISTIAIAQRPMSDKVKTLKVAFITDELQLTTEEAQAFWPIYNEHEKVMEEIRKKERMRFGGKMASVTSLSEAEASELVLEIQSMQKKKHNAEVVFLNDLKDVLPSKKIILLIKTELAFKRRLLQQYRKHRGQN